MSVMYEQKEVNIEVSVKSRLGFPPHFHPEVEVVVMRRGRAQAFLNFQEYPLVAGDIFVAFPNQIHHYVDTDADAESLLLIFPADLASEFAPLFSEFVSASPRLDGAANHPAIAHILDELMTCRRRRPPYFEAMTKGWLIQFAATLLPLCGLTPAREDTGVLREILNYCALHYREPLRQEDVAAALHVSRFHVSHLFSERVHMGFSAYLNRLRVADACARLRDSDAPVAEIAEAVGFTSLRSFNRVFRAERGVTPREYRGEKEA